MKLKQIQIVAMKRILTNISLASRASPARQTHALVPSKLMGLAVSTVHAGVVRFAGVYDLGTGGTCEPSAAQAFGGAQT